ncbi:hypothetical protein C8R46DRAFT_1192726 [Mycena filopes]|nr:hypothetical protein C8R46DRAFT_1192726 [Mycena filopes]
MAMYRWLVYLAFFPVVSLAALSVETFTKPALTCEPFLIQWQGGIEVGFVRSYGEPRVDICLSVIEANTAALLENLGTFTVPSFEWEVDLAAGTVFSLCIGSDTTRGFDWNPSKLESIDDHSRNHELPIEDPAHFSGAASSAAAARSSSARSSAAAAFFDETHRNEIIRDFDNVYRNDNIFGVKNFSSVILHIARCDILYQPVGESAELKLEHFCQFSAHGLFTLPGSHFYPCNAKYRLRNCWCHTIGYRGILDIATCTRFECQEIEPNRTHRGHPDTWPTRAGFLLLLPLPAAQKVYCRGCRRTRRE